MNKISQVEARRLKRRVNELESVIRSQRSSFTRDYPGGVNIAQITYASQDDFLPAVLNVSRKLGHAVVCTVDGRTVLFYAIPHKELPA